MHPLLFLAAFLAGTSVTPDHPISLEVTPRDGAVDLVVTGRSEAPFQARYRLEVSSADSGNRSVQGGEARLVPGQEVSLIHLTLAGAGAQNWTARLRVEPTDGGAYEEVLSASPEERK